MSSLAGMDGLAHGLGAKEVLLIEIDTDVSRDYWLGCGVLGKIGKNLFGEAHLHHMTSFAACDEAQRAVRGEASYGEARGAVGQTYTASQPGNGEAEPRVSFQAAMPQKITIGGAVDRPELQARHEFVVHLFPGEVSIRFFGFHVEIHGEKYGTTGGEEADS